MSVERDGGRVACEQPIELRFRASCLVALVSCCSHEEKWGRGGGGGLPVSRGWNRTKGTEVIHFGSWLADCRNTQNNNFLLIYFFILKQCTANIVFFCLIFLPI